ncbi:MAG: tyrosine-type recombinase/integrase, partial [Candidatus Eremiobacteraeota bacterium]|nr:tyrosine-type recombinase/integrase [Candidatus Eremiobacteraeota bacterium]
RWADRGGGPWLFYPDRCFTDPTDRFRTGEWWYNRVWYPAVKRAGIKNLRWHDLRHTCASRMIRAGVPEGTVGTVLGHTDPVMTRRYCHRSDDQLLKAVETIQVLPSSEQLTHLEGALGRLAADPQQQPASPDPSTDLAARLERLEGVLGRLVTAIEGGNRV